MSFRARACFGLSRMNYYLPRPANPERSCSHQRRVVEQMRDRSMFGFPRLIDLVAKHDGVQDLISTILAQLDQFRGDEGEQEDDVTMVTIRRTSSALESSVAFGNDLDEVASFTLDSTLGNEREAMVRVAEIVVGLGLGGERLERLKTAVSEAAMNAIEHGNQGHPELPWPSRPGRKKDLVRIRDRGLTPHPGCVVPTSGNLGTYPRDGVFLIEYGGRVRPDETSITPSAGNVRRKTVSHEHISPQKPEHHDRSRIVSRETSTHRQNALEAALVGGPPRTVNSTSPRLIHQLHRTP